jgi:hypothetical protein
LVLPLGFLEFLWPDKQLHAQTKCTEEGYGRRSGVGHVTANLLSSALVCSHIQSPTE